MINLDLNAEIYSPKAIEAAKVAYKDLANIDINKKGSQWIITFHDCRYDEERTIKEFENYLIGMENS